MHGVNYACCKCVEAQIQDAMDNVLSSCEAECWSVHHISLPPAPPPRQGITDLKLLCVWPSVSFFSQTTSLKPCCAHMHVAVHGRIRGGGGGGLHLLEVEDFCFSTGPHYEYSCGTLRTNEPEK